MAYFKIASTVIQKKREDGSTRNYKVIFERDLAADPGTDYEVPVIDEIAITQGGAGNEVNKPINPTVLSMNLRGAPTSNPLLAALKTAGPEEFKIKVEDSVSGFEWFYGKLTPEISKFDMYRKVKYFNVKAICGLADTAEDDQTEASFKTPDQLLESVHTSLGIARDNEFLVNFYHAGQTASTIFPTHIQLPAAGGMNVAGISGDDLKVYNELEGFCRAFGLRSFISEGKLKLVELHEQAFNPSSANRFVENAGSYTRSTTDLRIDVNQSNAIRDGRYQQKQFVKQLAHQLKYGSHKPAGTVTEAGGGLATSGNPEENYGNGYIAKTGDVVICKDIKFTVSFNNGPFVGELEGVGLYVENDIGENVYWDFVNKEWVSQENWYTLLNVSHPFAEAWTDDFTIFGFSSQPLPEGVVGELKFVALHQVNSVSEGDASYFDSNEITDLDMQVQQEALKNSPVYRRWSGFPDKTTGRRLAQVITIGDSDEFTADGVKYSTGGAFSQTTEWVDTGGNGRLGVVASRRLAKVLAGQKTEYRFEKRDLEFIDLATAIRITDDDGQVSTAVLTEVKHRLLAGYYELTAVTVADQLDSETELYAQQEVDSDSGGASSAGGSSAGGGGAPSGSVDAILANISALATDPIEVQNPQLNSDFTIGLKYGAGLELDGSGNLVTDTQVQDELVTRVIDNYLSVDALWDGKVSKGQFLQVVAGDGITVDNETERLMNRDLSWNISIDYDTGNLKMTGGALNTIQDIDTGADVQFNSLELDSQFDLGDLRMTDGILEALTGNLTLRALNGDIIFNGDTIQADHEITTADTIIKLNDEEPGNGVTAGFSGLQIHRGGGGSWPDYLFGFRESDDQLVLGKFVDGGGGIPDPSGLQALLTRQNTPTDAGVFYYNAAQKRADTSANLLFNGTKQTVTNSWYMETNSFAGGFTGSGMQLKRVDSLWRLELDDAFFRGAVFLNELIVNQISSLNGSEILSPGRGKVEEISGAAPGEAVKVSDPQGGNYASFVANDIVLCQQVRPNDNQLVKRVVRKVSSVSGNDITLTSLSGAPSDSGSIIPGDLIVAIGNTTDSTRQSVLYRSVTDSAGPFGRIKTGIDSWSAWTSTTNIPFQYGYLNNLTFNGVSLTGYGAFFEDNLYVRLAGGLAHFGKGADGDGDDGLYFDENNYWLTDKGFKATVGNQDMLEAFNELRTTVIDEYLANQGAFSQINAINGRILLRVAGVDEYIDQAVLDLKTTMIEQFLQTDGAYAGIQYLAGQLTLKVTDAGKIALVRLDATGEESVISIAADQVNIDATTTFSSGYDPSTKETPLGAQAKVNSLQGDIDAILDDAVANGTTIISGGYIQTSLIDVDDLFSNTATISALLTVGSSHELDGVNDTVSFAGGVLSATNNQVSLAGFSADANYFWTGTKKTGDGYAADGLTIYNDGSIRTKVFYTDAGANKGGLAGASFDVNRLWNYDADGGLELNWNSRFLKMYEGNQTLTRISILGDDWTLKTSADVRDSITNGTSFQAAIDIVDHELITGSITVKENNSGGSGPYSATLQYQGYNGSTWVGIDNESLNAFGQDSITRTFRFSGLSGFSQFRVAISPSSGSWSCTDYDVKQYKSEIIMNNRGLNFIGAGLFFHDLIQGLGNNYDIEQGQAFLDGDGAGNYYLKVKG